MPEVTEQLPVRYCHGCQQYDDHPRVTLIRDVNAVHLDELYHYDCAPVEITDDPNAAVLQPGFDATAKGKRGAEVREVMAAHAASIPEAPADNPVEG